MIKSIKTEVQLIHLKGHQDDDKEFEYETAPLSVRMNIDMDASAKLFLKQNQKQLNPNCITPFVFMATSSPKIWKRTSNCIKMDRL